MLGLLINRIGGRAFAAITGLVLIASLVMWLRADAIADHKRDQAAEVAAARIEILKERNDRNARIQRLDDGALIDALGRRVRGATAGR